MAGKNYDELIRKITIGLLLVPKLKAATIEENCAGWDFFASVERKLVSIRLFLERRGFVTDKQHAAVSNMVRGLEAWEANIERQEAERSPRAEPDAKSWRALINQPMVLSGVQG